MNGRGIMTIDGEDRDIAQGDLVYIPPDKVHSLRPVSDHAPIHCFCFAIGVKGAVNQLHHPLSGPGPGHPSPHRRRTRSAGAGRPRDRRQRPTARLHAPTS